nr:HNH endonuclease signature motif containing protein [Candidatus Njordarchaeota archaeon]
MPTKEFSENVKLKCLLWSYRHCCLCGKQCGTDIEIAHIDRSQPAGDNIDNAIPLCYNCHAEIGRYNEDHPMGNKYRPEELKARREQIYETHTRHLVPPIHFELAQIIGRDPTGELIQRRLPDVGFNVTHYGDSLPVTVRVKAIMHRSGRNLGSPQGYDGSEAWNLNPRLAINGHFSLPQEAMQSDEPIEVHVSVAVIDEYEREHKLLPLGWTYKREHNSWVLQPAVERF